MDNPLSRSGDGHRYPIEEMNPTTDIVVATPEALDAILADVRNAMEIDVTRNGNVTIDDIVSIVSIHRNAMDDRSVWWKIRREVYAHFASHEIIPTRTLAAIPDAVRDELAAFSNRDVESTAIRWIESDDSTPTDLDVAVNALKLLVDVAKRAKESKLGFCCVPTNHLTISRSHSPRRMASD